MTMEVLFAGVRVRDLDVAVDWYCRLFGRASDMVPDDREVMWRVADGGWLYIIEDPDRAGNGLVTISVRDLDAAVAELASRNVAIGPPEPVGDAGRKARTLDPDGNSIDLIEVAHSG